jgi:hypothetical protein
MCTLHHGFPQNMLIDSTWLERHHHLARARYTKLGSSDIITWLERRSIKMARANSVALESDLRSALDLGREKFLKFGSKLGFTSEIPQMMDFDSISSQ